MSIKYRRSAHKRGNSFSVTIPHAFLFNLEGDPKDYEVVWAYSPKAGAPEVKFEKKKV